MAYVDGDGYVTGSCGDADENLAETRKMLKALDAKLARRQLSGRI